MRSPRRRPTIVPVQRAKSGSTLAQQHELPLERRGGRRKPDRLSRAQTVAQTVLSTTLALIVLAGGAADSAAACTAAVPDDAGEEPVGGEDAVLAAGAV